MAGTRGRCWAERLGRLSLTRPGRAATVLSSTREDGLCGMQQERLGEKVGQRSLGSLVMRLCYGLEWAPHTELSIPHHVKKLGSLQIGQLG